MSILVLGGLQAVIADDVGDETRDLEPDVGARDTCPYVHVMYLCVYRLKMDGTIKPEASTHRKHAIRHSVGVVSPISSPRGGLSPRGVPNILRVSLPIPPPPL